MNVGIDAIASVGRGGNSTYTRGLLEALLKDPTDNTYYLFSFLHDVLKRHPFMDTGTASRRVLPVYQSPPFYPFSNVAWVNEQLVRIAARLARIDVFHFTNPLNFVSGPYASVVTVHDLAALHDEPWVKKSSRVAFPDVMREITMHADAIIAVSEYTKDDLIRTLSIPAEKITVIYEGAGDLFFPDPDPAYIEKMFSVQEYVLYAGQLQPRKNILNLVKAWGIVAAKMPHVSLVLAGGARDADYHRAVEEAIRKEGLESRVVLTGPVDDLSLRKLYSTAQCFVYPSLFEGFGLPVLEAFQCGTPVIASNTSSLPEVVGDAGLLVDPSQSSSIAVALEQMLGDRTMRESFRAKATKRAENFNWQKAAYETQAVYEKIGV